MNSGSRLARVETEDLIQKGSEGSFLLRMPVIVDDEPTWPEKLRVVFENNLEALTAYESERARIDALTEKNVTLRTHPPTNPHGEAQALVIDKANDLLADARIVGWHCTRLHSDEIAAIQSCGLHALSRELVVSRIEKRVAVGDLSPKIAARLVAESKADEPGRRGVVWLIFSRQPLRNEHGVIRLFRSWGGEALYIRQENDPETGPALREIGMPCIVEVDVPAMGITTSCSVAEQMMRGFLHRRGIETAHGPAMEGYVREPITGKDVRRVISRDDSDFELLTGCSAWRERISVVTKSS